MASTTTENVGSSSSDGLVEINCSTSELKENNFFIQHNDVELFHHFKCAPQQDNTYNIGSQVVDLVLGAGAWNWLTTNRANSANEDRLISYTIYEISDTITHYQILEEETI